MHLMTRHIVLISGASGSGKTTLIEHLRHRKLPPNLRNLFPKDCETWEVLELNDLLKGNDRSGLIATALAGSQGLLLHYDIIMPFRYRLDSYEADPTWAHLTPDSVLTIVFLRPDAAELVRQHRERAARQKAAKSALSRLFGMYFRQPIRALLGKCFGTQKSSTVELYASATFIDDCHFIWADFAKGLLRTHKGQNLVVLRPCQGSKGHEFEIVEMSGQP